MSVPPLPAVLVRVSGPALTPFVQILSRRGDVDVTALILVTFEDGFALLWPAVRRVVYVYEVA